MALPKKLSAFIFSLIILSGFCTGPMSVASNPSLPSKTSIETYKLAPSQEKSFGNIENFASFEQNDLAERSVLSLRSKRAFLEDLEGKDTENETKNAQKQPQTKNFSGKKLFASVGIILVFTLNIFTWFQPTFAAFKPVEVEFTGPAPYSQHANNVPRPSAYAMKEVEHLGLKLDCTPIPRARRRRSKSSGIKWNCSTKVSLETAGQYEVLIAVENEPKKLMKIGEFDSTTCENGSFNKIAYTNEDILNKYADYGVKLNHFNVDAEGKVTYPALFDSLKYADDNQLNPCDDFYEYVCSGVKKTMDSAAVKKGNRTGADPPVDSGVNNKIIVEQMEQFWLSHLNNKNMRLEFPKDNTTSDLLTFYDKCVNHAEEKEEFKDLLISQFKMNYLANNATPELLEFNTEWIRRTHPFNPFFSIQRIATKEFKQSTDVKATKTTPVERHEFRLQFLDSVMDPDSVVLYQEWLAPMGITGRQAELGEKRNKQIQAKLLDIAKEITELRDNCQCSHGI